jgi:hypothetical protein
VFTSPRQVEALLYRIHLLELHAQHREELITSLINDNHGLRNAKNALVVDADDLIDAWEDPKVQATLAASRAAHNSSCRIELSCNAKGLPEGSPLQCRTEER